MADLQRITEHIEQAATEQAAQIMEDAKAQYDAIMQSYQKKGEELKQTMAADARKEAEIMTTRAISAAAQRNAQNVLAYKNQTIEQVIEAAKQMLLTMDKPAYMKRMTALLSSKVQAPYTAGEIVFNRQDAEALTAEIRQKIAEYNLELASDYADISGGFLLRFGSIEENCSIDAIFREHNEKLIDFVGKELF